jgi:hypothetical protein
VQHSSTSKRKEKVRRKKRRKREEKGDIHHMTVWTSPEKKKGTFII